MELSAIALLHQARIHRTTKDFQSAMRCCRQAQELAPERADIWAEIGKLHLDLGDSQAGYDAATHALQLDPTLADAYYVRGWARGNLGDFEGELSDAQEGYRLKPSDPATYYRRLARAHAGKGEMSYALTCCHMVLAFDPKDTQALINRGGVYRVLQRYDEAIRDFERVITIAPHWYVPHYAMGLTLIDAKRYIGAVQAFSRALETDPDSSWYPRILAFRGYAYGLAGNAEAAERDNARAHEIDPNVQLYGPYFRRPSRPS